MQKEEIAALNTGKDSRLLDHLAPLCEMMQIPLFLTDENNHELISKFYPNTSSHYVPTEDFSLFTLAERYPILIQSTFWEPHLMQLIKSAHPHARFGYCPHGNSDKGHQKGMMEPIQWQDFVFLYGEHMVDRLKKQNLWKELPPYVFTGNYRLGYYQKYQTFYDTLVQKEIFSHLNPNNPTILYAPTWNDEENSSSFYTICKNLIQQLPEEYNLIIKTHPLLQEQDPAQYYRALPEVSHKRNFLLLEEFPPIFPLLAKVDVLLGDASSIGYDFLHFENPMFFFNPFKNLSSDHPSTYLHRCGIVIPEKEYGDIFTFMKKNLRHFNEEKKDLQRKMWTYAFGIQKNALSFRNLFRKRRQNKKCG